MTDIVIHLLSAISTRLFLVLLYTAGGLLVWRHCLPKMSTSTMRLAGLMLAAQVMVLMASLLIGPSLESDFQNWLWNLNMEWNVPATLAAGQLALVGGVAILSAWLAPRRSVALRVYLASIGLVFLFLTLDEFFQFHEALRRVYQAWHIAYAAMGGAVAVGILLVAARTSRRMWMWHACMLIGLGLAGASALLLDSLRYLDTCAGSRLIQTAGCMQLYEFEESLEFLGIWLTLVAVLGYFSGLVPSPSAKIERILYGLFPAAILLLVLSAPYGHVELSDQAERATIQYGNGVHIHGFAIDIETLNFDAIVHLPDGLDVSKLGYSMHLVDQLSGASVASGDDHLDRKVKVSRTLYDYRPLYRQRLRAPLKTAAPFNRALRIVLSLWREQEGDFVRQEVQSSDLPLLDDTQVILSELVLPAEPLPATTPPLANFENGFALDAVDVPERAEAGELLDTTFAWRANSDGDEDFSQFLHLFHEDGGGWWGYDQAPLGARLPTRLWYAGLADSETWRVPLPDDLAPGRYKVFTGLYRVSDLERVQVTDAEGKPWPDNQVALGSLVIE